MGDSIFSRKRDLVYLIHFSISLPMAFLMDLQAIYPSSMVPSFMLSLKNYYIDNYNDRFFVETPPFFKLFIWSELFFQAPVMLWALGGLYRNSPKFPLVLLPYSTVVFLTTVTCMFEFAFWPVPSNEKVELCKLYGPYLAISAFMGVDMYLRLNNVIAQASTVSSAKMKKAQ
ncbi:putative membrane protein [Lachnellula subtilissima]|uniref:Efficient mitochondria targeting-associated protein 19 n=1 Tax=Lachnellula subtilissima TaxID=602034 RepID=A0A8H8S1A7_9HELO|nr:putative membrane protein [Lachnellula subtilissima]